MGPRWPPRRWHGRADAAHQSAKLAVADVRHPRRRRVGRGLGRRRLFSADILWVDTAGKAEPRTLLDAEFRFSNAAVSPDGRWLAYQSNESGAAEIFVRPFPALDSGRWPVSTGGGTRPLWSRDGKEIFYLDASGFLTAVAVERREDALSIGRPEVVIRKAYVDRASRVGRYDVSPDGTALPDDQGSHAGAGRCRWPDRPGAELVRRAAARGAARAH